MRTRDLVLAAVVELVGTQPLSGAVYFGPHVDGDLVRRPVIYAVKAGNARGIDVLIGSNRHEIAYFAQFDPSITHLALEQYRVFFPAGLDLDEIAAAYPDGPGKFLEMLTDQTMRVPATRLAQAQGRWARSYLYQFDWGPAVHTAELPFVFGTLTFTGIVGGAEAFHANPGAARALSAGMRHAWTLFARTGDPGWPQYRQGRATRIWNTPSRLEFAPREAGRTAWDDYDFRFFQ